MVVGGSGARGVTRLTKLGIAFQVVLVSVLSIVVAGFVVWFAARVGRHRADWTADGRNTLDAQTLSIIDRLEAPVAIDVFFRPVRGGLGGVVDQSQGMMLKLLHEAGERRRERIELVVHDTRDLAVTEERMRELGIDRLQTVVVSLGSKRVVLGLLEDIAEIDPGNSDPRRGQTIPPTLTRFRGEPALAEAIATVATPGAPLVVFSTGHGELDPRGAEDDGLALLTATLEATGWRVAGWNGARGEALPQDCTVLVMAGPEQPLSEAELETTRRWVEAGGRLLVSTGQRYSDEPGTAVDLLGSYGMLFSRGIVCEPVRSPTTGRLADGISACALFRASSASLSPSHAVTAPLVRGGRSVAFHNSRSFERGPSEPGRVLLDLVSSGEYSWRDLPGEDGRLNYGLDPSREQSGPFRLALVAQFVPEGAGSGELGPAGGPAEEEREGRVIGLASRAVLSNALWSTNRDFVINTLEWLAARDLRIRITPREARDSSIDLSGTALSTFTKVAWWGMPGVCAFLGILTWLRRRRG